MIAWSPVDSDDSPVPDAIILGDVNVSSDEFQLVKGAGASQNGRTSTFLFYASGSSTRVIHPDSVPKLLTPKTALPTTPYEDFVLSRIDSKRSVRDIQKTSGLEPQEIVVTMLTLLDKGAIEVPTRPLPKAEEAEVPGRRVTSKVQAMPSAKEERSPTRAQLARKRRLRRRATSDLPTVQSAKKSGARQARRSRQKTPPPEQRVDSAEHTDEATRVLKSAPSAPAFPPLPSQPDLEPPSARISSGAIPEDFEDLPEVSSFAELNEDPTVGATPLVSAVDDDSSFEDDLDDVWSTGPASSVDASFLIESEVPEEAPDERATGDLEAATEMAIAAEDELHPPTLESGESQPPPIPEDVTEIPHLSEDLPDDGILPRSVLLPPEPPPLPLDEEPEPPPKRPQTPPVPLDPAFLIEVPGRRSTSAPTPASAAPAISAAPGSSAAQSKSSDALKEERKKALAAMLKRGPIQERDRRRASKSPEPEAAQEAPAPEAKAPKPPKASKAAPKAAAKAAPVSEPVPDTVPPPSPSKPTKRRAEGVDSYRMVKAEKLFEQALKDKAEGNLVSARMNMKLALTFDPTNELFEKALSEISKSPDAQVSSKGPTGRSKARELYDAATEAEQHGDVDRAIELLEQAIERSKQAPFYNRLGVLLAMKKRRYMEAQALISQALELMPNNATYEKNLQKILSMAAAADVRPSNASNKKGGLLGFLGRRK